MVWYYEYDAPLNTVCVHQVMIHVVLDIYLHSYFLNTYYSHIGSTSVYQY